TGSGRRAERSKPVPGAPRRLARQPLPRLVDEPGSTKCARQGAAVGLLLISLWPAGRWACPCCAPAHGAECMSDRHARSMSDPSSQDDAQERLRIAAALGVEPQIEVASEIDSRVEFIA